MSWPTYSLDELGSVSRGRSRHRPRDAQHLYGGPFPFVQTGDVKAAPLYLTTYSQTYSEAGLAQSKLWPAGTLCITIAANIAETCILGIDACFPDSIIGFVADPTKAYPAFIKYQFDAVMRDKMKRVSQGVAQDNLSQDKLLSFRFPVPDLPTQQRIASILSAYDYLIENNRRRIALLEKAARLVYREWFVHLRFPGHETAKIVDGLPEGIKLLELGQVCRLTGGSAFKMHLQGRRSGQLPFIKVGDMNSAGNTVAITEANHWVDDNDARELKAKPFARGTVVFAKIGEALKQNRVRFLTRDTLIDNNLMAATPNPEKVSTVLLFCILVNYDIASHASGAAVPFLSAGVLSQIKFLVPNKGIMERFDAIVEPILAQTQQLSVQNAKLTRARDLLLPRLMDGRILV